jgi:hypothetical protein
MFHFFGEGLESQTGLSEFNLTRNALVVDVVRIDSEWIVGLTRWLEAFWCCKTYPFRNTGKEDVERSITGQWLEYKRGPTVAPR